MKPYLLLLLLFVGCGKPSDREMASLVPGDTLWHGPGMAFPHCHIVINNRPDLEILFVEREVVPGFWFEESFGYNWFQSSVGDGAKICRVEVKQ